MDYISPYGENEINWLWYYIAWQNDFEMGSQFS